MTLFDHWSIDVEEDRSAWEWAALALCLISIGLSGVML